MASLESLRDPLSRLGVLGTSGSQSTSWRRGEVNNATDWDATKQYYLNDMVFSGIDGGAYVMTGGPTSMGAPPTTAVKGGDDPAAAWAVDGSVWEPVAAFGPRVVVPGDPQTATAATSVITFSDSCSLTQSAIGENVPLGVTNYMVQIQCSVALPAVATATDYQRIVFTPDGTSPVARQIVIQPLTGETDPNHWAGQLYLEVPIDATQIAVTGAYSGQVPTISNLRVVYAPVTV
jgi:hypothetical protein